MEKPLLTHHLWPLHPELLREDAQDLDDVDGIGRGIPGHAVSIDEALAVKECQQRLFGSAGMDLGIYWAWLPLLYPRLGLFLGLLGIVRHHCLIHCDNGVHHGERAAVNGGNKISADVETLLFLLI